MPKFCYGRQAQLKAIALNPAGELGEDFCLGNGTITLGRFGLVEAKLCQSSYDHD
jgi:hypothetical protein